MKWLIRLILIGLAGYLLVRLLGYDMTIGGLVFSNDGIGRLKERGYRRPRLVLGGCVVSTDIDVDLMIEVTPSLMVVGGFVGPKPLADAYGGRLRVIGGATLRGGTA